MNPELDPAYYTPERCLKVTLAAEKLLREMGWHPSEVMDGLAPRPRPGQKLKAQQSFTKLLKQIHMLRREVERTRPWMIVGSTSEEHDAEADPVNGTPEETDQGPGEGGEAQGGDRQAS